MTGEGRKIQDAKYEHNINELLAELPDYAKAWNTNMIADKKATSTRLNYLRQLRKFLSFCDGNITQERVDAYRIASQESEGKETSSSYQIGVWNFLNSFFKYMVRAGYMERNLMDGTRKPVYQDLERIQKNRHEFTDEEFKEILAAPKREKNSFLRARNTAIISVMLTTGIRETEVCSLMLEDIDMTNKILTVVGKRNETHTFVISGEMERDLSNWIDYRNGIKTADKHLFIAEQNNGNAGTNGMSQKALAYLVKKYTKKVTGKALSPHKLRSGVCMLLIQKTGSIDFTRRYIGHKREATTERYAPVTMKEKREGANIMSGLLNN